MAFLTETLDEFILEILILGLGKKEELKFGRVIEMCSFPLEVPPQAINNVDVVVRDISDNGFWVFSSLHSDEVVEEMGSMIVVYLPLVHYILRVPEPKAYVILDVIFSQKD